jgi:hypothetical protein
MEAAAATLDRWKKMQTHQTNDRLFVPRWGDVEVDKIPGYWVLTLWLPDDITLRLKVRHGSCENPDDCIAEIRLKPDEEFRAIHEFSTAVYALSHPDEFPDVWDDMPRPSLWTREFATLAHMWARLTEIAEFGGTISERYAGEPHSSRDHYSLGATDEDKNPSS